MPNTTYTLPSIHGAVRQAMPTDDELIQARKNIEELTLALGAARVIGAAVGVIMTLQKVTYEAAFAMLVALSQAQNRKLRDIADEIVHYGGASETTDLNGEIRTYPGRRPRRRKSTAVRIDPEVTLRKCP